MQENRGNSDQITRRYLDSLLVETRYLNSETPNMELELYGKKFSSPVMGFLYSRQLSCRII